MNVSMEDDDCAIEAVKPAKKKKLKQAQLPFQTLSSVESSPNSINSVPNKKKRKVTSPLVGFKSSKVSKFSKKDCFNVKIPVKKHKVEDAKEKKDNECIVIMDDKKNDVEQSDWQNDENKNNDVTHKRSSLGKNKNLDRSQWKSGALTKFLKKTDEEEKSIINHNTMCESKDTNMRQDLQAVSIQEEKDEICSDDISKLQSSDKSKSQISKVNENLESPSVHDKDTTMSFLQESDMYSDDDTPTELDESISSRNEEIGKSCITTHKDAKKKLKRLMSKQLEKRQEIARKKEEKLKLKMEKEKMREEKKANQQREREEKQKEKEEKRKEKELKELRKQMEIEQKQKEKEAKEEERKKREEAKEEERRKREEAKEEERKRKEGEKLEAERKKQKVVSSFVSFFVSKKHEIKQREEENVVEAKNFMPFEIKADMKIAPICRRMFNEQEKSLLDEKRDTDTPTSKLYLQEIKKGRIVPRVSSKTWPLEAKDDIVLLDDDNNDSSVIIRDTHNLEKHRPKLLQFKENRRPPYWGTWRKQSKIVNSRRPFVKDTTWFDYEIDSDDEWEEEEPGESLKGSDDEDEENPEENEYDVDNEFMVPHGYLSDEEAQADEEEKEDMSPQTQKLKLKILGEQFEAERNVKTQKLKPKILGCIWTEAGNLFPQFVSPKTKEIMLARQAWVRFIPIMLSSSTWAEGDSSGNAEITTTLTKGSRKTIFPNEALTDLIQLLHGNTHSRRFLMREFMTFWHKKNGGQLSKTSVLQKINDIARRIACPEEGPMHLKSCWYVTEDIREQYLPDKKLPLPNCWTYILTPTRKNNNPQDIIDKPEREEREKEKDKEKKQAPLITQFAKKITQKEMKRQLLQSEEEDTSKQQPAPKVFIQSKPKLPLLQKPPKRATLISVGRGEQFPEKCHTLARFIGTNKKQEQTSMSNQKMIVDNNDDDIIFIESINADEAENKKSETNDEKAVNCDKNIRTSKEGSTGENIIFVENVKKDSESKVRMKKRKLIDNK